MTFAYPFQRVFRFDPDHAPELLYLEHRLTRLLDLQRTCHDAGQFYWGRSEVWLQGKPLYFRVALPIVCPRGRIEDIDTLGDWERAEKIFSMRDESNQ